MDYITKYYKNLSEDLQRRLNQLINEASWTNLAEDNQTSPPGFGPQFPGGIDPSVNPYPAPDVDWETVPWNPNRPQNPLPPDDGYDLYQREPNYLDYDLDGDGVLNDDEYREFRKAYEQWETGLREYRRNRERWKREVRDRNRAVPGEKPPRLPNQW